MRFIIETEELYPIYRIEDDHVATTGKMVTLIDSHYERLLKEQNEVMARFWNLQKELSTLLL